MKRRQITSPEELDTVLTFGGSGRSYHIPVCRDGGLRPVCSQYGSNPLLKDRVAIESHYDACENCFAPGRVVPADALTPEADDGLRPDGGREEVRQIMDREDHYSHEALTPEELVEEYDEELLDQLEDTPMAPAVRAVRQVARGEYDD